MQLNLRIQSLGDIIHPIMTEAGSNLSEFISSLSERDLKVIDLWKEDIRMHDICRECGINMGPLRTLIGKAQKLMPDLPTRQPFGTYRDAIAPAVVERRAKVVELTALEKTPSEIADELGVKRCVINSDRFILGLAVKRVPKRRKRRKT